MRGFRSGWPALFVVGAMMSGGCTSDPSAARWEIRLDESLDPATVSRVEAQVLEGGCDGAQFSPVYTLTADDEAPTTPIALAEGMRYGLWGRAVTDACMEIAAACVEFDVPIEESQIVLLLGALETPRDDCSGVNECVAGRCVDPYDCTDLDSETPCGAERTSICLPGDGGMECVPASCGDGYVTGEVGEQCDPADAIDDGCDPVSCQYECEVDADCDDGSICTFGDVCGSDFRCREGIADMEGAVCTRASDDEGRCRGGSCAPVACSDMIVDAPEEDCDDGNLINGDGCDNDCSFSCVMNEECSNSLPCDGEETCDTDAHRCVAGEPVDCNDDERCTIDVCDDEADLDDRCINTFMGDDDMDGVAMMECTDVTLGGDCDDDNPATYPGAPETCDMEDNDCDGTVDEGAMPIACYLDMDRDGYGRMDDVQMLCACSESALPRVPTPPLSRFDCQDEPSLGGAQVNPGVTAWQSTSYCLPNGTGCDDGWDWNCDGDIERRWTGRADCSCGVYKSGWDTATPPACGELGTWVACELVSEPTMIPSIPASGEGDDDAGDIMLRCESRPMSRRQECR